MLLLFETFEVLNSMAWHIVHWWVSPNKRHFQIPLAEAKGMEAKLMKEITSRFSFIPIAFWNPLSIHQNLLAIILSFWNQNSKHLKRWYIAGPRMAWWRSTRTRDWLRTPWIGLTKSWRLRYAYDSIVEWFGYFGWV